MEFAGVEIASSDGCIKVLETSHPPVFYFSPSDVRTDLLRRRTDTTYCEWKDEATYFDVRVDTADGPKLAESAVFAYEHPSPRFRAYAGWYSFYAGPMDACWVGDERARPQPGGFYSGWVTSDVVGPFKGGPGSLGW